MIALNVTLFIQIANFLITYLFLRAILLDPFFKRIKQKEQIKKDFLKNLDSRQTFLQKRIKEQRELINSFHDHLKEQYPKKIIEKPGVPLALHHALDEQEISRVVAASKAVIMQEVSHVSSR